MRLAGVIPEVRKLCQYEVKGQVLLLKVNGRGDSTIILSEFWGFCFHKLMLGL